MLEILITGTALACLTIVVGSWLAWQLLRQNGRILLRLDDIEERLHELEFGEAEELADGSASQGDRANRFGNGSLARSKINRSGLKAGTRAPEFRLPRLDGGELSLEQLRGRRVLLVFSDPHCGPCNHLAPELEKFHRENSRKQHSPSPLPSPPGEGEALPIELVMISRGEPKENRAKVKEHGLTFPIILQQQWEISRRYAMFATPIAYLIDENGVIAQDVAVGVDPVLALLQKAVERPLESASLVSV